MGKFSRAYLHCTLTYDHIKTPLDRAHQELSLLVLEHLYPQVFCKVWRSDITNIFAFYFLLEWLSKEPTKEKCIAIALDELNYGRLVTYRDHIWNPEEYPLIMHLGRLSWVKGLDHLQY